MEYFLIETISCFLPYSCNWIFEMFNCFDSKPLFFSEYYNGIFSYEKIRFISTNEKEIRLKRLLTEFEYYKSLNKLIKEINYNKVIIHSHFGPKGYYDNMFTKKKYKNKIFKHFISFYGYDISESFVKKWKEKYLSLTDEIHGFIVLGKTAQKKLENIGLPKNKIHVLHLGIDLAKIKYKPKKIGEKIRFCIVGRFTEKKAIPFTINAFKRFHEYNPNSQLVIIGDSDGSPEQSAEKEKILQEAQGNASILFRGVLPYESLLDELSSADVLLQPSITAKDGDEEGTPMSIVNAMAYGLPVIATDHSDIPEIIEHGKEGILIKQNDLEQMVEAMKRVTEDGVLYKYCSQNAREKVEKEFNLEVQAKRLKRLYEE